MRTSIVQAVAAAALVSLAFCLPAWTKQVLLRYPNPGGQGFNALAADKAGDLFTAGSLTDDAGRSLVRVNKLDAAGHAIASFDFGASGQVAAAATDAQGNVIVVGTASAAGFTSVSPLFPGVTGTSAFIVKIDSQLQGILFSTLVAAQSGANAVTVDSAGNIYVAGYATPAPPVTAGAYHTSAAGAFILEIAPDGGKVLLSTQFGGSQVSCTGGSACIGAGAATSATAIAVDSSGGIVFAGDTTALDLPVTAGTIGPVCGCTYNIGAGFAAKLSPGGGQLLWSTYLKPTNPVAYASLKVYTLGLDGGGDVVIGGTAPGFQTTPGTVQPDRPDGGFIAKLSADGTQLIWSTYIGGRGPFYGVNSLALNAAGEIAFTGQSDPTLLPPFPGVVALGNSYAGWLSADGSALEALYVGPDNAAGGAVAITASGGLAATGIAGSMWIEAAGTGPSLLATASAASGPVSGLVNPFELISLYGSGIGPETALGGQVVNGAFTTSLGGYSVTFDGIAAPLLYAGPNQINAIVPGGVSGEDYTQLRIVTPGGTVDGPALALRVAQPYVFQNGATGLSAALNQDGTINSPENPAKYGSIVTIYATGSRPAFYLTDGMLAPLSDAQPSSLPVAVIGSYAGTSLEVEYAGDAPGLVAGAMQVNFRLPALSSALKTYMFYLEVGGVSGGFASVAVSQ